MQDKISPLEALLGMTLTGLMIGLGQLLGSDEKLTPRIIAGPCPVLCWAGSGGGARPSPDS